MSKICGFFLFLFAFSFPLAAQNAKEIVRKADEKVRGNSSVAEMVITTIRPKWTRSMEMKSWSKGTDYALILVKSPAKDKGIAYLKRKKEVWNWLPSLEKTVKLPPSMMGQSWMGTDFTNDDLVRESSMLEDYDHSLLGKETISERSCFKIQMIPKANAAVVWGKVLVWIDEKDYMQLKVEFYDEDGSLVNTMIGSNIKNTGRANYTGETGNDTGREKGNSTIIEYKSLEFNQPIADSFFTTDNMTKVK